MKMLLETHDGDTVRRAYVDTDSIEAIYEADNGLICVCLNRTTFLVAGTLEGVMSYFGFSR